MEKKSHKRKSKHSMANNLLWLWLLGLWGGVILAVLPGGLDLYNPAKATLFVILAATFPFIFGYYKNKAHEGLSMVMSPGTIGIIAFMGALLLSFAFALQKQNALWGYNMSIGDGLVFYFLLLLSTVMFLSFPMRYVSVLARYTLVVLGFVILLANLVAIGAMLGMFKGWLLANPGWANHLSFLDNRLFHPSGGVLHGLLFSLASIFVYVRLWFKKDPFSLLLALLGGVAAAIVFVVYASVVPYNQLLVYVLIPIGGVVLVSIIGIVQAATPKARLFISSMAIILIILSALGIWLSAAQVYKKFGFNEQTNIVNITLGDSLITAYNQFSQGKSAVGRALVGSGMGTYQYMYAAYRPDSVVTNNQFAVLFYKAANYPLTLLSGAGFIGVLIFLFILGYVGRMAVMAVNNAAGNLTLITIAWTVLFWMLAVIITFGSVPMLVTLWLMMGLLISVWFKEHKLSRHLVGLKFQVEDASLQINRQREGLHIITWVVWPIFMIWLFWQIGTINIAQIYNYRAEVGYNKLKQEAAKLSPKQQYQRLNDILAVNDKAIKTRFDYTEMHHRRALYLLDQYQLIAQKPETVGAANAESDMGTLYSNIEREFNYLTNRDPYDYRFWYTMFLAYRAQSLQSKGRVGVDNTLRSIREALRLNQYELNMRVEYVNFLLLLEDKPEITNEALRQVSLILEWNRGFARAYLPLARIFEKQKKYDRAIETYQSLIDATNDTQLKETLLKRIDELKELQKKEAIPTPAPKK